MYDRMHGMIPRLGWNDRVNHFQSIASKSRLSRPCSLVPDTAHRSFLAQFLLKRIPSVDLLDVARPSLSLRKDLVFLIALSRNTSTLRCINEPLFLLWSTRVDVIKPWPIIVWVEIGNDEISKLVWRCIKNLEDIVTITAKICKVSWWTGIIVPYFIFDRPCLHVEKNLTLTTVCIVATSVSLWNDPISWPATLLFR